MKKTTTCAQETEHRFRPMTSCRYFDSCSAPICPEDPASMQNCAWFPDEEICRRGDYAGTAWIHNQKRIAKATAKDFEHGCFTMAMLAGITRIGKGTRGLDPENAITPERAEKWLAGFKGSGRKPTPPVLTEEQKAARIDALRKARVLKRSRVEPMPDEKGSKGPSTG